MRELLYCQTSVGKFLIVQSADGRFHPVFRGFSLGSFDLPHEAAVALARGQVLPFPGGIDTSTLGIPEDLERWRYVPCTNGAARKPCLAGTMVFLQMALHLAAF